MVVKQALVNPKSGKASTLVHLFQECLAPGSKHRQDADTVVRLTGNQFRAAEEGVLFSMELPATFAEDFCPELPDAAIVLGNVLQQLKGPSGIPDLLDPRNAAGIAQPIAPPGLGRIPELLSKLDAFSVDVDRYKRDLQTAKRSDNYGISSATVAVAEAAADFMRLGSTQATAVATGRAAQQAYQAGLQTLNELSIHYATLSADDEAGPLLQEQMAAQDAAVEQLRVDCESCSQRCAELTAQLTAAEHEQRRARRELQKREEDQAGAITSAQTCLNAALELKQGVERQLEAAVLQPQATSSSSTKNSHERVYVTAGNGSMSAPVAYIKFITALLTVKWARPTDAQLNSLSVLKRGHETFAGEAQLQFVTAVETYTEYFTRVKGYKRLLQLFNRDRDLTSPMLAGLGSTPVDEKVRTCVQASTFLLPARDRTPHVIERMVMQALDAVTDEAEAVRQASIKQLADANGLGVSAFFEQKRPQPSGPTKLRLSDVKPGLQRPAEGWGDSLEVIARKVGPGPNDLCQVHTGAKCKILHTNAMCRGQTPAAMGVDLQSDQFVGPMNEPMHLQPVQAAPAGVDSSVVAVLQQLLQGLQFQPAAYAADPTFRSTVGVQQNQPSGYSRGPASPRGSYQGGSSGFGSGSRGPSQCDECGRFHFGACWGKNKERAPVEVQERARLQQAGGSPRRYSGSPQDGRGSPPAGYQQQQRQQARSQDQRTVYAGQPLKQQAVAAASAMYPAECMHPGSMHQQQRLPILPKPRASSYAEYKQQLGGFVPTDQPAINVALLAANDVRWILQHANAGLLSAAATGVADADGNDVFYDAEGADDTTSVLSSVSTISVADSFAAQDYSLDGSSLQGLPAAASLSPAAAAAGAVELPPLQEAIPRTFVQQQVPVLSATTRRSSRIAARQGVGRGGRLGELADGAGAEPAAAGQLSATDNRVQEVGPPSPPAPSGLSVILMTDSEDDQQLMDAALAHAGFKGVVLVTSALTRLLQTGALRAASVVPAMTEQACALAARLTGSYSVGGGGADEAVTCVKHAPCGCMRCLAEDDNAAHGPGCPCLACLPPSAAVDQAAADAAAAYLSRDACITYVADVGGYQIGVESAAGQFVGLDQVAPDSAASMSCQDLAKVQSLGLHVQRLPNMRLQVVTSASAKFEGLVSTRIVYKPGTRHELVVPMHALVVEGLDRLASLLLGRVEQHRIGAVLDTKQQEMLYMPKLHLGREYHASIPLVCHKPSPMQLELQQLARDATTAVAAAIPVPRGPFIAALVEPVRYQPAAVYADDMLVWDAQRQRYVAVDMRVINDRAQPGVAAAQQALAAQQLAAGRAALQAPRRFNPAELQHYNAAVERLILSGDVEPNPGPELSLLSGYDFALFSWGWVPPSVFVFQAATNILYNLGVWLSCRFTAAAVVHILLIRSGDVELNPGPPMRDAASEAVQAWRCFQQKVAGTFRQGWFSLAGCWFRNGGADHPGRSNALACNGCGSISSFESDVSARYTCRRTSAGAGPVWRC
jgi:hypothetical protein